jgi:hypothetical protein
MKRFVKTVLLTGLLVGTTDIIAAYISTWIRSGSFPSKLLHYIAGGLLGLDSSMDGGWAVALLGLGIHYFIAMTWTAFYFAAAPKVRLTSFNPYIVGFFYAVFVASMMNYVVLPLTALPKSPPSFQLVPSLIGWTTLSIVLGMPIAVSTYRFYCRGAVNDKAQVPI